MTRHHFAKGDYVILMGVGLARVTGHIKEEGMDKYRIGPAYPGGNWTKAFKGEFIPEGSFLWLPRLKGKKMAAELGKAVQTVKRAGD